MVDRAPREVHQRHLRNYLLDRHFQLKYTAYLVGIVVVTSVALGFFLWRTSQAVLEQSRESVGQGEKIVTLGRDVVGESRKVSEVVKMNIVEDPVYSDNPELLEAFKTDHKNQEERLQAQQAALEQQATALKRQSEDLVRQQRGVLIALSLALSLLVVLIGLAGIVVTHRVAGPVFKMKRQLGAVAEGKLAEPGRLRKGDELMDFFEAFNDMVHQLRARHQHSIETIDGVVEKLQGKASSDELANLRRLRDDMERSLHS